MNGIAQVQGAGARERLAVAARARGDDAIKHVDPAQHRTSNIIRLADAHKIMWPVRRQMRNSRFQRFEHRRLRLAHREPAYGITIETDLLQLARRVLSQ